MAANRKNDPGFPGAAAGQVRPARQLSPAAARLAADEPAVTGTKALYQERRAL
ncbi:MAG: hypothetical protein M0Z41_11450 [Peptococcaceae bacterium]|nr:hypothetical protein [Peptococcaceae bacterium]